MQFFRSALTTISARVSALRARVSSSALFLATAVMCNPAFADLPVTTAPAGVADGDLIGMWQGYAKLGLNVLILILGALAFIMVAGGAMEKWRHYGKGKIEISELKEYIVAGVLVLVVVVFLLTAANKIL